MRRYYPNELSEIGEWRPRDTERAADVTATLECAGLSLDPQTETPAHITVHPSTTYYAIEVRVWARDEQSMPDRDALQNQAIATLRQAGYVVHAGPCAGRFGPVAGSGDRRMILAYLPRWGGQAPPVRLMAAEVADYLGVEPSTWRAYVSRGQAPEADGPAGADWLVSTIDQFVATRPGRPGRPKTVDAEQNG